MDLWDTWLDGATAPFTDPNLSAFFRPGYAATVSSSDPATMQCHLNTSFTGNAPECKAKDHFLDQPFLSKIETNWELKRLGLLGLPMSYRNTVLLLRWSQHYICSCVYPVWRNTNYRKMCRSPMFLGSER